MTNNRKRQPNVATPSNSTKQEIFVKTINNSIKTKAKGSCKTKKKPMPQNLQLDYSQSLDTLADYRANSSFEEELADQLKESYEQYQAWETKDSYCMCTCVNMLQLLKASWIVKISFTQIIYYLIVPLRISNQDNAHYNY